jgi:flagellar protein FlaG
MQLNAVTGGNSWSMTDSTFDMNRSATDQALKIKNTEQLKHAELEGRNISIGEKTLIEAIEKANKAMVGTYTTFEFSIHEQTKQIMVKVLDRDTGEMIREIPPEKILDLVAKMWEMAGILIDEKR